MAGCLEQRSIVQQMVLWQLRWCFWTELVLNVYTLLLNLSHYHILLVYRWILVELIFFLFVLYNLKCFCAICEIIKWSRHLWEIERLPKIFNILSFRIRHNYFFKKWDYGWECLQNNFGQYDLFKLKKMVNNN